MITIKTKSEIEVKVTVTRKWYATLCHPKMHLHTKFGIPTSKNIGDMHRTLSGMDGRTVRLLCASQSSLGGIKSLRTMTSHKSSHPAFGSGELITGNASITEHKPNYDTTKIQISMYTIKLGKRFKCILAVEFNTRLQLT